MDELWIIITLVFFATLLGVGAVYRLGFQAAQAHRAINRRLALSEPIASPTAALDALQRERGVVDIPFPLFQHANDLLMQTGLKLNRTLLLVSVLALSAMLFFAFGLIFEYGLIAFLLAILAALSPRLPIYSHHAAKTYCAVWRATS